MSLDDVVVIIPAKNEEASLPLVLRDLPPLGRVIVVNNGSTAVSYDPAHRSVGGRGASLYGKGSTFKRVKFGSSVIVEGQQDGTTQIQPGGSLTDFVLFDRPPEGTTELTFEYPASLFGGSGLGRFAIDYEYKDPPKPKELEKPEPKKPEPEQGG